MCIRDRQANIRALKKEILKAQKLSQGKGLVAINAMVALKDYEELINAALESKVDAIISGAVSYTHLDVYKRQDMMRDEYV